MNNTGYIPNPARTKRFVAQLPDYHEEVMSFYGLDDGQDVFMYRPLVRCLKKKFPQWVDGDRLISYSQGSVGSCHLPDTEVLTKDGWKLFTNLTLDDELASVNPDTNELIYEKPTHLINKYYKGDIYYSDHKRLDFAVTADHKMLVRKWNEKERTLNDNYELVEANDMGWYCGLMANVNYKGNESYSDEYLQLLGIYIAEGCMRKEPNKSGYSIQLAAVKDREKDFIRNLLTKLHITFQELTDRFTFCSKSIWNNLKDMGLLGKHAPQKFAPKFLFDMSSNKIEQFLLGHRMGDGCERYKGSWDHYTSSEQLSEDLQLLIFLSGKQSRISVRPPRTSTMKDGRVVVGRYNEYRICSCPNDKLSIERKNNIKIKEYEGQVVCATVPTYNTLITRRNKKILISGNCVGISMSQLLNVRQAIDCLVLRQPEEYRHMSSGEGTYGLVREACGMRRGDGAYGSGAAEAVTQLGTLWMKQYGDTNLDVEYSASRCRTYGSRWCSEELKQAAKEHKILSANNVKTAEQAWALVGGYCPIQVCSNRGFRKSRDEDGACRPSGSWSHAMSIIGRRTTKSGRKLFLILNSWGENWCSGPLFEDQPKGSFYADYDVVDRMLRQGDSYNLVDLNGFRPKKLDWDLI